MLRENYDYFLMMVKDIQDETRRLDLSAIERPIMFALPRTKTSAYWRNEKTIAELYAEQMTLTYDYDAEQKILTYRYPFVKPGWEHKMPKSQIEIVRQYYVNQLLEDFSLYIDETPGAKHIQELKTQQATN